MTTQISTKRPRVRYITLGCRVNQYETQGMREILSERGYESGAQSANGMSRRESDPVELVVINTCTVTAKADKENLYWVRRAKREHPEARIVVTGCGVERDRETMEAHPGIDVVISNFDKARIGEILDSGCAAPVVQNKTEFSPLAISQSQGRTRAFIKVQDGCNHACSFCKIVLVRGRSRSRPLKDILEEVTRLRDAGYRDFAFAGIQLGAYGQDSGSGSLIKVEDILYACSKIEGVDRLRLSSIEPTDVEPSLIEALREIPACANHLHIPLQSGDSAVLADMNRRYDRQFYLDLVTHLRERLTDFQLTMDVMAGFPSETEERFENSLDLLREVKPLKCHVFPYSRREGTRSSRLPDLPATVVRDRVNRMLSAGEAFSLEARKPYLSRVMPVLVEQEHDGQFQGLTENFMKVQFEAAPGVESGQVIPVKLNELSHDGFLGIRHSEE